MKQALKNIFRPDSTVTMTATVTSRLGPGRYEIEDASGRMATVTADTDSLFPVGVAVVVQSGRIIGGGQLLGKHKVMEV